MLLKLCEEKLSVKPAIAHKGCRLGKPGGVRLQQLLVIWTRLTQKSSMLREFAKASEAEIRTAFVVGIWRLLLVSIVKMSQDWQS